jgi:hypothetical protein
VHVNTLKSILHKHANVHLVGGGVIVNVLVSEYKKGPPQVIKLTARKVYFVVPIKAIKYCEEVPMWKTTFV